MNKVFLMQEEETQMPTPEQDTGNDGMGEGESTPEEGMEEGMGGAEGGESSEGGMQ